MSALRIAAAAIALLFTLGCPASLEAPPQDAPEGWVTIGSKKIAVEIADTPVKQNRGLGYRDSLAWDTGMYFPYAQPAIPTFWMKGMRFSIDIIWIRAGRIIDIHHDVPFEPGGNGPTLRPREAADAVLEVPAGNTRANGWRVGDRVVFARG